MLSGWFKRLLAARKSTKIPARERPAPSVELAEILKKVRDSRSRFSRIETLDTLDDIEARLTAEEKATKPGALLHYIRGHLHALDQNWGAAQAEWEPLADDADLAGFVDDKALSTIAWGRVMQAYEAEDWAVALEGFDARLAAELAAGKTALMETWRLQMMRGWCLAHLGRADDVEALAAGLMSPGPDDDEAQQMYSSEIAEPLRFLSHMRFGKHDLDGALAALRDELDVMERFPSDELEFALKAYVDKAVAWQRWRAAHEGYERYARHVAGMKSEYARRRAQAALEQFSLKRIAWPKG